jgi:hypothetical protein
MKARGNTRPWWAVPLVVLVLPITIIALMLWLLYSLGLYLAIWACWGSRGRNLLFVYSDSPHWKDYIESEILPHIRDRAMILNWSDRNEWIGKWALGPMAFRHFGGDKEFNPIALYFRPFAIHRTYRFWEPIRRWRKNGDRNDLDALLARLYADLEK